MLRSRSSGKSLTESNACPCCQEDDANDHNHNQAQCKHWQNVERNLQLQPKIVETSHCSIYVSRTTTHLPALPPKPMSNSVALQCLEALEVQHALDGSFTGWVSVHHSQHVCQARLQYGLQHPCISIKVDYRPSSSTATEPFCNRG